MSVEIDYTLNPDELDMMCDLLPEFYNVATVGPRFREINWDEEFKKDMITKKGFIVKTRPFKKKLKDKDGNIINRGAKEMDGIHSPRFGSDWTDENAFADRFSCECGHLIGRIFEGRRCPKCGKKVKFVDVDLSIFAWLKINNPEFTLIHPLLYRKLDSFFGKGVLAGITEFKMRMTLDGYYEQPDEVDLNKYPFFGIGMLDFKNRFMEILEYYKKKRKHKIEMYKEIVRNIDKIFTTSVPIYSSVLRQVFFTDEDYAYSKIDKRYNAMFGNIQKINEETDVNIMNIEKINKSLFKAQTNLNKAFDLIFTSLSEKEGLIRRNILGGRVNFSARNVIIPDSTLRSYEIRLPYVAFIELAKEDIINLLVKLDGVSYNVAVNQWFDAYRSFSPRIYSIMKYILKHSKHGFKCLLNRNPKMLGV